MSIKLWEVILKSNTPLKELVEKWREYLESINAVPGIVVSAQDYTQPTLHGFMDYLSQAEEPEQLRWISWGGIVKKLGLNSKQADELNDFIKLNFVAKPDSSAQAEDKPECEHQPPCMDSCAKCASGHMGKAFDKEMPTPQEPEDWDARINDILSDLHVLQENANTKEDYSELHEVMLKVLTLPRPDLLKSKQ
jgi:hypothetical protein